MNIMKELLNDAQGKKYALGAFNITSITYLHAILDAAQELTSPVIIALSERHIHQNFINLEATSHYINSLRKNYSIPIIIHLDHGESLQMIHHAIDCNVDSVMIDRSHAPLSQNIDDTKTVVLQAAKKDIAVEGELGMIGGKEGDGNINQADTSLFTDPLIAQQYVSETNIDSLAIAIGNVHGKYKGTPQLDFSRLKEIQSTTSIPLVLHGGSGISDEDFKKLINNGIHKINYYSGNFLPTYDSCQSFFAQQEYKTKDVGILFQTIYKTVKENVMKQLLIFGSAGKA